MNLTSLCRLGLFGVLTWAATLSAADYSSSGVPDDEAMAAAKAAGKTPDQAAREFYPQLIVNYFRGMDVISAPAGSTSTNLLETWPDPLLDLHPQRGARVLMDPVATPSEVLGRNTWMIWCGGNEAFWDWLADHSLGFMDLLKLLDSRKRGQRWHNAGMVNEPEMRETVKPADGEFGLWLDQPVGETEREYRRKVLKEVFSGDPATAQYQNDPYGETGAYSNVPPWRIYGLSSGVIGLRLFPNPNFDARAQQQWDARKYYRDSSYYSDPKLVRPFRVGMSCAFCHASAHPLNPPQDPANPRWENLSGSIGSQYLRIRAIFGNLLPTNNFVYHVLDSQPPGTIDTSLIASDNINNPNTMNAIFGVPQRILRSFQNPREQLAGDSTNLPSLWWDPTNDPPAMYTNLIPELKDSNKNPRWVPRVLLDGADSIGVWGALARVYLNIGTYSEQWIRLHEPLIGFLPPKAATNAEQRVRTQLPFTIKDCREHSLYWRATQLRVGALRDYFLKITPSMPLLDARGPDDVEKRIHIDKLARGRRVFARNCIVCHSSVQPETNPRLLVQKEADLEAYLQTNAALIADRKKSIVECEQRGELWDHDPGQWLRRDDYAAWATQIVELPEFWRLNFLSTDFRVPVNYVGTNPKRAMANNGTSGHLWEDFSSASYKGMASIGSIPFFNPYKGPNGEDDFFTPRHRTLNGGPPGGGGPGFYRPASLMSIWATAPFLHNNSLGLFNNDPSVKGRLAAFDDAVHKLLWLDQRAQNTNYASAEQLARDHGLIWRTPCETYIIIPAKHVPAFARRLPWPSALDKLADVLESWGKWKAVPSIVLLVAALVLLLVSRGANRAGRLERLAGYASLALALVLGLFIYFLAGGLGDLRLGPIPAGTPVDLLANINPDAGTRHLKRTLKTTLNALAEIETRHLQDQDKLEVLRTEIAPALLRVSKCPDFVMDKGHYFPWFRDLSDDDKEALIELMKTF